MTGLATIRFRITLAIAAIALLAIVAWPVYIASRVGAVRAEDAAAAAGVAPLRDDQLRNDTIAFWEGAYRERHRNDFLSPRQLAGQYLQRYRETGDIDDVRRAERMARASLKIQPRNIAALADLVAIDLTLHRFRAALRGIGAVLAYDPQSAVFLAQKASLLMELGEYRSARATIERITASDRDQAAALTVRARYAELTGRLGSARRLLADATVKSDADDTTSAQGRAWYHFRAGELAFEAGDNAAAIDDERAALGIFPTYNLALKDLAKFELAEHRYADAVASATRGALVTPFPETLGYEADAQAALGDVRNAARTRDAIFAIERIGNAYGVNDRLLAIYYADHHLRARDTLSIARREVRVRGDEIYAQDTLAWAAAMAGRWSEARAAMQRAMRFGTQDPMLAYHAGVIAQGCGDREGARRSFARALATNPHFHATFADDARARLSALR